MDLKLQHEKLCYIKKPATSCCNDAEFQHSLIECRLTTTTTYEPHSGIHNAEKAILYDTSVYFICMSYSSHDGRCGMARRMYTSSSYRES